MSRRTTEVPPRETRPTGRALLLRSVGVHPWRWRRIGAVAVCTAAFAAPLSPWSPLTANSTSAVAAPPLANAMLPNAAVEDGDNVDDAVDSVGAVNRAGENDAAKPARPSYDRIRRAPLAANLSVLNASPTGEVSLSRASEVRWQFDRPVVDLAAPEDQPLPNLQTNPRLDGELRWATTRTLVFVPTTSSDIAATAPPVPASIPTNQNVIGNSGTRGETSGTLQNATTYEITLPPLRALDGTSMTAPSVVRFSTPRPSCALFDVLNNFAAVRITCDGLRDTAQVASKAKAVFTPDPRDVVSYRPSVADLARMRRASPTNSADFDALLARLSSRKPIERAIRFETSAPCNRDDSTSQMCHTFSIDGDAPLDTALSVKFAAGLRGDGPLPSVAQSSGRVPTTRAPVVLTTGCRIDCNPESQPLVRLDGETLDPIRSSGHVTVADITKGRGPSVVYDYARAEAEGKASEFSDPLTLSWANLQSKRTYEVRIDRDAISSNGVPLGYTSITTFSLGRYSAFAYLTGGERVVEVTSSGIGLQSRNVPVVEQIARRVPRSDLVELIRAYGGSADANFDIGSGEPRRIEKLPSDATASAVVPFPDESSGVFLVGIRPKVLYPSSRYDDEGNPWNSAEAKRRRDAAREAARVAGPTATPRSAFGDGWSSAIVQKTDLALTLKRSPTNVLVAASQLSTGKAVAGVKVSLYDRGNDPYWSGRTDDAGLVVAPITKNKDCARGCELIAVAEGDGQIAYAQTKWRTWGSAYSFDDAEYLEPEFSEGEDGGDTSELVEPTSTLAPVEAFTPKLNPGEYIVGSSFTDRGVYKVGEEVKVKGVLRTQTIERLEFPIGGERIEVALRDPNNAVVERKTVSVDNGAFDTELTVPADGAQGRYTVEAGPTASSFLVTTFRKPDFTVNVAPRRKAYVRGETARFTVDARYLFGAPLADTESEGRFSVSGSSFTPVPEDDPLKLGSMSWFYQCRNRAIPVCQSSETALETSHVLTLDNDGRRRPIKRLPVDGEVRGPLELTYQANVTDVSRQSFASRATTLIHPGDYYVGVRQPKALTGVGEPLEFETIAVTPKGQPVADRKITVELVLWEWITTETKNADGSVSRIGDWRATTVNSTTVTTTATGPVRGSFVPRKTGEYEIRVSSKDDRGNALEAGMYAYVLGEGYVPWYMSEYDDPTVNLVADKSSYRVGDTARVLVQSPWPKAEGLLTLERNGVLEARRFTVSASSSAITVPITTDHAPNVYVSVTLMKGRTSKPPKSGSLDSGRPQALTGFISLSVPPVEKKLSVRVRTDRRSYRPGAQATARVLVRDAKGEPASGEVTLWAIDEGVLRLTNYSEPDLLGALYPERAIAVVTSDSRMQLSAISEDDKGDAAPESVEPGGGGDAEFKREGASEGSGDVRSDFRLLAAWSASVNVGANGRASVPMKLPDSLTAYRVIAVASSGSDRFGTGKTSIEVKKPLLLLPALPRFVNLGDQVEAGVVVHNTTGQSGPVTVALDLPKDSPVRVQGPSSITLPNLGSTPTEVRFRFSGATLGTAPFTFRASLVPSSAGPGAQSSSTVAATRAPQALELADLRDALRVQLPVITTQRTETVVASGQIRAGSSVNERITLPDNARRLGSQLDFTASSSSLAGLQNSITNLVEYPYGCLEQRSSRVRVLLEVEKLARSYVVPGLKEGAIRAVVQRELSKLAEYETVDGGLAYWPGSSYADEFLTPRVLLLLIDARDAGYRVPAGLIDRVTEYLADTADGLSDVTFDASRYQVRAQLAWALAAAGRPERALNDLLVEQISSLSYLEKVHTLRALLESGVEGRVPNELYRDLLSSVRIDGERASVVDTTDWRQWNEFSFLAGQERVLETSALLSLVTRIDRTDPLVGQMSRWLLAQRRNGVWQNTLDSGYAMSALLDVATTAERRAPDFTAEVLIGSTKVISQPFVGKDLAVVTTPVKLPANEFSSGSPVPLTIRASEGEGTLHWSARLTYALDPKNLRPIDRGFAIERTYTPWSAIDRAAIDAGRIIAAPSTTYRAGDLVRVTLAITTSSAQNDVVIDDPLPAGLEAINGELDTSATEQGVTQSGGIDRIEIRDDRVLLFARSLPSGSHFLSYVARATSPGRFVVAPTQASDMYRPDIFGRTGSVDFTVTAPSK